MSERKTIHRWWWVWDFEKEEAWLNSMAAEGWTLDSVDFCTYHFVKSEPDQYHICLVMQENNSDYMSLMNDIGADYIGRVFKWQYFKRKTELGAFEMFSDLDSKIAHMNQIARMLMIIGGLNILMGVMTSLNTSHAGFINLLCGCLLMYGLGRIHGKIDGLRSERMLHE